MPDSNTVVSVSTSATPMPLLANEQVLFLTRPSLIITLSFITLLWLVGTAFLWVFVYFNILKVISVVSPVLLITVYIAVFLFVGLIIFLSWLNTEYILTNKRVEMRFGIIGSGTISIALDKIQNVFVNISVIGFILNFGSIRLEPAGLTNAINFNNIPSPKLRREQIEQAIG